MTSRRTWPKADLLQQRRLALGLSLQPAPAPPLLFLVIKGSIVSSSCRPRSMHSILWRSVLVMPKLGCVP